MTCEEDQMRLRFLLVPTFLMLLNVTACRYLAGAQEQEQVTSQTTVRDKLWMWSHPVGAHNEGWGIPTPRT